jgi:hypothetical protein
MGLYIQTYAAKPKGKKWPWSKSLSKQITVEAENWAVGKGIGNLFYSFETTPTLSHFTYFPLNESLRFEIDENQVSIGVKTSSVGAGYHAAFVDLCDHLEIKLGLKWNWMLSGQESGDETDYAVSKNFKNLQGQHFEQAVAILNHVFSENMQHGICVHVDTDLIHNHNKIAGPRGYIEPISLSDFQNAEPEEIKAIAEKLLTWQEYEIDSKFWRETLEGLLWHEFSWRVSGNSYEDYIESSIKFCQSKLAEDEIPDDLSKALNEFKFYSENVEAPHEEGIGYKKRRLFTDITGPWRCSIPGYFVLSIEDNNSTCNFTFDEIVCRGSSVNMELKDGSEDFNWPKDLLNSQEIRRDKFVYRLPTPVALENEDENWYYGMGMGVTPNIKNKRFLVMFSVTAKNQDVVSTELQRQFETGIAFKGVE